MFLCVAVYRENAPRCSSCVGIGIGVTISVEKSRQGLFLRDNSDADPEIVLETEKRLQKDFQPQGRCKSPHDGLVISHNFFKEVTDGSTTVYRH